MSFARGTWRFLVGVKDLLVLLLLLIFFGILWAVLSQSTAVTVPGGGALVLNLEGVIVDQASEQDPTQALLGSRGLREIQVRDVVIAIDNAASDNRISTLVLDLDTFIGSGQANLQAIGRALTAFRKSGKPIEAYATAYTDDSYYLAARADRVWLNPFGGVLVSGPGSTGLYFARALEKLNVDIELFRVGTYKAAVEPFVRNDASPEARAADQALVDGIWAGWKADTRAARPAADIDAWLRALPQRIAATKGNQAEAARAAGLVDVLGSRTDFEAALVEKLGEADANEPYPFKATTLGAYSRANRSLVTGTGPAVGVLYVSGEIVDGEAPRGTAGGTSIADAVKEALASNNDLKALVVRIDSPGGSVLASEEIRRAITTAKESGLPIIASMGPVAASGGYWVATAADRIYAEPSTVTGSIGVFAVLPTFPRALEALGIGRDGVKSTPYSGEPDLLRGLGSETRQLLQISVEDIYGRFISMVATSRNLPVAEVDRIGQGRVWTGSTALKLKLVDELGGLDMAIAEAARRAGIKSDGKVRTVDIETARSPVSALLESLFGPGDAAVATDPWATLASRSRMRALAMLGDVQSLGTGATMRATCLECAGMGSPRPAKAAGVETAMKALASGALQSRP
ncbi:protease 4 [Polymorphobacter multimanifer]|uniref:Protease-4 n=1 Tax=Polymorphobacter multimanifer TaxID=1070431 RepID=A0A841L8M4_9SPHN|nr:signal peptide peptidase SppA [Polymorphobacter multimanifer]MBB6228780.1 protease-4 [Polymorphobacter multimanifer]GGI73423.1 protease 4 [Polymorphobacter multimanifer]